MFLNQAQAVAFSGFLDGQVGPDPQYGTCLQCAAVDRARLKTRPVTPRSAICSGCFKKYCYDPQNPPPEGQIVGRRFQFKDPDPFLKEFYQNNKSAVIVGAVIAVLALLASFTGCAIFWRKRFLRKKAMSVAYQQVARGEDVERSAHVDQQGHEMAAPHSALPSYDMAYAHYAEQSYDTLKPSYTEPNYDMGKTHHKGLSGSTAHDAEPSYVTAKSHFAAPSYEPEPEPAHYAAPSDGGATLFRAE